MRSDEFAGLECIASQGCPKLAALIVVELAVAQMRHTFVLPVQKGDAGTQVGNHDHSFALVQKAWLDEACNSIDRLSIQLEPLDAGVTAVRYQKHGRYLAAVDDQCVRRIEGAEFFARGSPERHLVAGLFVVN